MAWLIAMARIYQFTGNSSQICIKRSLLGQRKSGLLKTGDLLKEIKLVWNCPWQTKATV